MDMAGATDTELFLGCRSEVEAAFDELFRRVFPALVRWVRLLGLSHEDAEDVAQETIVKVLLRYEPQVASVSTYAHRLARNAAIDRMRRRGRREDWLERVGPVAVGRSDEEALFDAFEISDALRNCLRQVTNRRAIETIWLMAHGLKQVEIAEVLDIPRGTVYAAVMRARARIETCLGAAGVTV